MFNKLRRCFSGEARREAPAYVQRYREAVAHCPAGKAPWSALRFVVLDTESTGTDPARDALLSIGAVGVYGNEIRVEEAREWFIRPESALALGESAPIHGIIASELAQGQPEEEVLAEFLDYIGNAVLVAHHAGHDLSLLGRCIRQYAPGFRFRNPVVDTVTLSRRIEMPRLLPEYVQPKDYSLDALSERYQILRADRHTALGDAYITAQLLLKLLSQLRRRGISRLRDLTG